MPWINVTYLCNKTMQMEPKKVGSIYVWKLHQDYVRKIALELRQKVVLDSTLGSYVMKPCKWSQKFT